MRTNRMKKKINRIWFTLIAVWLNVFLFSNLCYTQTETVEVSKVGEWGGGYYQAMAAKSNYNNYIYASLLTNNHNGIIDIIDANIPNKPVRVSSFVTGGGDVKDMLISGDTLYTLNSRSGLQIYDLSNPEDPQPMGFFKTSHSRIFIHGIYAYLASEQRGHLEILDISNLSKPVLVGYFQSQWDTWVIDNIEFSGKYGFMTTQFNSDLFPDKTNHSNQDSKNPSNYISRRIQVIDLTHPTKPVDVAHYETPATTASDLAVSGNYLYYADGPGGLTVMDISDPAHMIEISRSNGSFSQGSKLEIVDHYAYITNNNLGIVVFDISNPNHPTQVGSVVVPDVNYLPSMIITGNYAYVIGNPTGISVIDITDRTQPVLKGSVEEWGNATDVIVSGDYAYLTHGSRRMRIIDISNPTHPVQTGTYRGGIDIPLMAITGNYAILTNSYGFDIVDISDKAHPFRAGGFTDTMTDAHPVSIAATGNYVFYARETTGYNWIQVYDITDKTSPVSVASISFPYLKPGLKISGNYLYVNTSDDNLHNAIDIFDISDKKAPVRTGTIDVGNTYFRKIDVSNNYLYLAGNGLTIINVSNPAAPTIEGKYNALFLNGISVTGNRAYTSSSYGLHVFDVSHPDAPTLIGSFLSPTACLGVASNANVIYLTNGAQFGGKLVVLQTSPNPISEHLTLIYPNGGEFISGTTPIEKKIVWTQIGLSGNVVIELRKNNSFYKTLGTAPAQSGVFNWSIPADLPARSDYKIHVTQPWNLLSAYSDSGFTVSPGQDEQHPPIISIDNSNLTFSSNNFQSPQIRAVTITNTGTNILIWEAKADQPWIIASPTIGREKGDIIIEINPSGLPKGTYTGKITITGYGVYGNLDAVKQEITVNLTITDETPSYPQLILSKKNLSFNAVSDSISSPQIVKIKNFGGSYHWNAMPLQDWIQVVPTYSNNQETLSISVNTERLLPGEYNGKILITAPDAINSPQEINVNLNVLASETPPFGELSTPTEGASTYGSIPVTGWALDDIEVSSVKIYRNANTSGGEPSGKVYIGDAVFIEGARPDVALAYPNYPQNTRAGWGYMLLSHFLPNGGNGTYTLYAVAVDKGGNETQLGAKTISVNNAESKKPFGTIDTPTQGGDAEDHFGENFGWALTPMPNMIPFDGSTIHVWIDGADQGTPVYNQYREDIAALFPGYANSNGAVGYYHINTSEYADGLHTIQWTVTDNAGNTDGIGSRYFTINNASIFSQLSEESTQSSPQTSSLQTVSVPVQSTGHEKRSEENPYTLNSSHHLQIKKGYDNGSEPLDIYPDEKGIIREQIEETDRIEIRFEPGTISSNPSKPLPIGSSLNKETGIFTWNPGPGFIGEYNLEFLEDNSNGEFEKTHVAITIVPKFNKNTQKED